MPNKPLEISLNVTAQDLYNTNPEYKAFQEGDAQPMGVTFQGYDFPRYKEPTAIIKYSNGELSINGVMSVLAYEDNKQENYKLSKINLSFLFNHKVSGISDEDAYKKMMSFFKELQDKGWTHAKTLSEPRLTPEESFIFATTEDGNTFSLNYTYPLSFEQWMQLDDLQTWQLRHGTDVFMNIRMNRQTDPSTGKRHYLISLEVFNEVELLQQIVPNDYDEPLTKEYSKLYGELPEFRLFSETAATKMGLKIQQDQPDYTLPLVLKETGIDTSKFVSIDPYKITYEEFMQRQEAGEDMTPYYENKTKPNKPEITSQAKGRCPANQPCPKSGYWFTQAKSDRRAYFKQGDIMPDYPNNNWGEVIWQFDGLTV
ncbi:hypothetical protein [Psychrobacter sp. FME5]|uniref:hypothetical protein n=1 Tax=Psychrobacter sp. FME5 TaxID=2487706 RepID=UPI0017880664|nr:hypothetical protein [Psychrobacter sp. FME5]MBE0444516.1 hypothetical protein [Psychrobacter sp. FME5]